MVGLKNFAVWVGGGGDIVANRYLISMGASRIGTSVLTTSLNMFSCPSDLLTLIFSELHTI